MAVCANCGAPQDSGGAEFYSKFFALQRRAHDLGRDITTGGGSHRGGTYYGMVIATYAPGSRVANSDSWHCHHRHPDELSALECALGEVQRAGPYAVCSAGPDCQEDECRRDWAGIAGSGGSTAVSGR